MVDRIDDICVCKQWLGVVELNEVTFGLKIEDKAGIIFLVF